MKVWTLAAFSLAVCLLWASIGYAQNSVSGEVTGTVTDSSGAIVPNAKIKLSSADTGVSDNTTTSSAGTYRFALLKPGNYTLTVVAPGFRETKQQVLIYAGQVTTAVVLLQVGVSSQIVEVTAEAPLLQTENANLATTYDRTQIELLPSPGQDLTNYAMTAPGIVQSTGAGYGNFTANGMPGTSNLYTVNGNDYNDPYLNLNNSGASNLLLGANELQELTVVTNGYTGEYGRAAGANVSYITKSGTNQFHGNLAWYWNGRTLNANDWFNVGNPRPFANSNQWAGSFGGPIKKDKLFFFYDNEGLRYVLPGSGAPVFLPTSQFEAATIANLTANSPQSLNYYNTIFGLYNGAPGINRATAVTDTGLGCGDFAGTAAPGGGTFGTSVPCAQSFISTVNNLNTERLMSVTVDLNATKNDTLRWRYKQDRGTQATGTDPINAAFNANSVQPEDDGQMIWTHTINDHMYNQLIASGLYYQAIFGPSNLAKALATFPTTILYNDGEPFNNMGGSDNAYPQGRKVTQWQIVDDVSWTKGNHGVKFGVDFRRNDISSFAAGPNTSGAVTINSMTDFYNGVISPTGGSTYSQSFANSTHQPIAYYSLGLFVQDEWRVSSKLKLTLALRADRNSNEVCQHDCFSRPADGSFASIDHSVNTPYNASIITGLHNAFPSLEAVGWGPRGGFAWTPFGNSNTVIRGGVGIFTDLYQGLIADRFITNLPNVSTFTLGGATLTSSVPLSPDVAGNVFTQVAAQNTALQSGFASGGTQASILATLPPGSTFLPSMNTISKNTTNPRYVEWNLQIERAIGTSNSFSVNYVGNHGSHLFIRNPVVNTFASSPFGDLPLTAPDQRFGSILELQNDGTSNYDGITASVTHRIGYGFTGTFNYTYMHSLDDVSNGGLEPYNGLNVGNSLRVQIDPNNLRRFNYGNSDYNFPHTVSANYYWQLPFKSENKLANLAIRGWAVSGALYSKSGEQFSIYDTAAVAAFGNPGSARVLATYLGGPRTCGRPSSQANLTCLTASQFAPAGSETDFGNTSRNFFRGPAYFNTDFSVQKDFRITESGITFTLGANAFNILNHPNFDNPVTNAASSRVGQFFETVTPPNSPYGNFQGAAVSGRVLQLDLKFKF
jgi:hypothetical protein